MLRKSLELSTLVLQLASTQPNFPPPEQYVLQVPKPAVHAQASITSNVKNTDVAIYKRIIAEGGPKKEDAISNLLDIYKLLTDREMKSEKYSEKSTNPLIDEVVDFYNSIITDGSGRNKPKALLHLGILIGSVMYPSNFDDAIGKLKEAYKLGDSKIKSEAALNLGLIYWNYSNGIPMKSGVVRKYRKSDAINQFRLSIKHDPNSGNAEKAKKILKNVFNLIN